MNELIKITRNEKGENAVSARGLHEFLGVKSKFADWIKNRISKYEFVENQDFVTLSKNLENGGKETDYIVSLDMAKELAMVENNDKGRQARRYFIECEKQLKVQFRTPSNMIEALQLALEQQKQIEAQKLALAEAQAENEQQKQVISELKPIKEYVDTILASKDTVTISQIGADYGLSGRALNKILHDARLIRSVGGQWLLYADQMKKGYTSSETVQIDTPHGKKSVMHTKWTQKGRLKIHEILTSKGIQATMDKE